MEGTRNLELSLGLPGADDVQRSPVRGIKRGLEDDAGLERRSSEPGSSTGNDHKESTQPSSKLVLEREQVVGWPPVRSYRKIALKKTEAASGCMVKVSLDGAPYLRKMDLNNYGGYKELREALESMFKGFSLGEISEMEGCNYAVTYEDKDQDLMLVGDVPWDMFISSCKRLRIMRRTDARFGSK